MNYLFIGGIYPDEKINEYKKICNSKLSYAAEKHQRNIIMGLEKNIKKGIPMINAAFLPAYPICKKITVERIEWSHCKEVTDINVKFFNLRGIRQFSKYYSLKKELDNYLAFNKVDIIICYTLFFPYIKAINMLKRLYNFKVICIVPDLPLIISQYIEKRSLYGKISQEYNLKKINQYRKCIDKYVLLTKYMAEELNISTENFCVIDGLYNYQEYVNSNFIPKKCENIKKIVYTGSINKEYGIKNFLDAFYEIKRDDIELLIAGDGNLKEYLLEFIKKDKRIKYLGVLSEFEVKKLQKSATILVNPRISSSIDAKYSFPSKTIEYMLSGTPVLMEYLPGMEEEYKNLIINYNGINIKTAKLSIEKALQLSEKELNRIAKNAFEYIYFNKSNISQTKKILELI